MIPAAAMFARGQELIGTVAGRADPMVQAPMLAVLDALRWRTIAADGLPPIGEECEVIWSGDMRTIGWLRASGEWRLECVPDDPVPSEDIEYYRPILPGPDRA